MSKLFNVGLALSGKSAPKTLAPIKASVPDVSELEALWASLPAAMKSLRAGQRFVLVEGSIKTIEAHAETVKATLVASKVKARVRGSASTDLLVDATAIAWSNLSGGTLTSDMSDMPPEIQSVKVWKVRLETLWGDYETGINTKGRLTDPSQIAMIEKYSKASKYSTPEGVKNFDPSKVFVSEFDLTKKSKQDLEKEFKAKNLSEELDIPGGGSNVFFDDDGGSRMEKRHSAKNIMPDDILEAPSTFIEGSKVKAAEAEDADPKAIPDINPDQADPRLKDKQTEDAHYEQLVPGKRPAVVVLNKMGTEGKIYEAKDVSTEDLKKHELEYALAMWCRTKGEAQHMARILEQGRQDKTIQPSTWPSTKSPQALSPEEIKKLPTEADKINKMRRADVTGAKKWMGSPPVKCDLCGEPFKDVFYDAKTSGGPWGLLCEHCFQMEGGQLGTGLGQKYDLKTKNKLAGGLITRNRRIKAGQEARKGNSDPESYEYESGIFSPSALRAARVVTDTIAQAFKEGKHRRIANTSTDGQTVWLHNNAIARKSGDGIEISLAGWPTATTRERLNGILSGLGIDGRVSQRGGSQMLNGKPWDGEWTNVGVAGSAVSDDIAPDSSGNIEGSKRLRAAAWEDGNYSKVDETSFEGSRKGVAAGRRPFVRNPLKGSKEDFDTFLIEYSAKSAEAVKKAAALGYTLGPIELEPSDHDDGDGPSPMFMIDILKDGKVIGTAENDGWGGGTSIQIPESYFADDVDLEMFVDAMVEKAIEEHNSRPKGKKPRGKVKSAEDPEISREKFKEGLADHNSDPGDPSKLPTGVVEFEIPTKELMQDLGMDPKEVWEITEDYEPYYMSDKQAIEAADYLGVAVATDEDGNPTPESQELVDNIKQASADAERWDIERAVLKAQTTAIEQALETFSNFEYEYTGLSDFDNGIEHHYHGRAKGLLGIKVDFDALYPKTWIKVDMDFAHILGAMLAGYGMFQPIVDPSHPDTLFSAEGIKSHFHWLKHYGAIYGDSSANAQQIYERNIERYQGSASTADIKEALRGLGVDVKGGKLLADGGYITLGFGGKEYKVLPQTSDNVWLFRDLAPEEAAHFIAEGKADKAAGREISALYHPVYQDAYFNASKAPKKPGIIPSKKDPKLKDMACEICGEDAFINHDGTYVCRTHHKGMLQKESEDGDIYAAGLNREIKASKIKAQDAYFNASKATPKAGEQSAIPTTKWRERKAEQQAPGLEICFNCGRELNWEKGDVFVDDNSGNVYCNDCYPDQDVDAGLKGSASKVAMSKPRVVKEAPEVKRKANLRAADLGDGWTAKSLFSELESLDIEWADYSGRAPEDWEAWYEGRRASGSDTFQINLWQHTVLSQLVRRISAEIKRQERGRVPSGLLKALERAATAIGEDVSSLMNDASLKGSARRGARVKSVKASRGRGTKVAGTDWSKYSAKLESLKNPNDYDLDAEVAKTTWDFLPKSFDSLSPDAQLAYKEFFLASDRLGDSMSMFGEVGRRAPARFSDVMRAFQVMDNTFDVFAKEPRDEAAMIALRPEVRRLSDQADRLITRG